MPTEIQVGTHTYKIVLRETKDDAGLEDAYGYTVDSSNLIVIRADMPASKRQQTLLHELLHVIRFVYGSHTVPTKTASPEDWEHHFITLYEQPLLTVFKDNPDLYDYLMDD